MNTSKLSENYNNINKLGFDQIWKGASFASHKESMDDLLEKLKKAIADVVKFDEILALKDEYIAICDKIVEYYKYMSSCSASHTPEEETNGCSNCSYYSGEITKLENQRKELRAKIIGLLANFIGIDAEIADQFDFGAAIEDMKENGIDISDYPLYDQTQYDDPFGSGTISSEGCGITCAAMLISFYTSQTVTPADLANNPDIQWNGNDGAMQNALDYYGIEWANNWRANGKFDEGVDMYYNTELTEKLKEGYTAIILMNECNYTGPNEPGGGHFVLATGITEDGRIIIQDPYGPNYQNGDPVMQDGLENGFNYEDIDHQISGFWLIESPEAYQEREMPGGVPATPEETAPFDKPTMKDAGDSGFRQESDNVTTTDDGFYIESDYSPEGLEYR